MPKRLKPCQTYPARCAIRLYYCLNPLSINRCNLAILTYDLGQKRKAIRPSCHTNFLPSHRQFCPSFPVSVDPPNHGVFA